MTAAEHGFSFILESRKRAGEITDYGFERYTLKLGRDCRYSPDFHALCPDGAIDFFEVKGEYIFPKALVKPRVAASLFKHHRFYLAQRTRAAGWSIAQIYPDP